MAYPSHRLRSVIPFASLVSLGKCIPLPSPPLDIVPLPLSSSFIPTYVAPSQCLHQRDTAIGVYSLMTIHATELWCCSGRKATRSRHSSSSKHLLRTSWIGKSRRCTTTKGGEYMSKEFNNFCNESGILRTHTTRNRPQQNSDAERANRMMLEDVTAMLAQACLPASFWGRCLATLGLR